MRDSDDYYETLQVHGSAEPEVIEAAYRRLARMYHPDTNASPDAASRMTRLNVAYATLSDAGRRAEYDTQRRGSWRSTDDAGWAAEHEAWKSGAQGARGDTATSPRTVGRWFAVLPGGVLAALAIMFPVHWFLVFIFAVAPAFLVDLLGIENTERLIIAFSTPFVFVRAGAAIAPFRKMETAIGLAVIAAIGFGATYTLAFTSPTFAGWYTLYYGATPALNLAGLAAGLYQTRNSYVTSNSRGAAWRET